MNILFTFLAGVLGYLACWFFWGVPLPVMLLLLFGGALLWMRLPGSAGGWFFPRSLAAVVLVFFIGWLIYWAFAGVVLVSLPDNPLPIGWETLILLLLLAVGAVIGSVYGLAALTRASAREQINTRKTNVLAPWLWVAGVLAFAFFPAVRVDCRAIDADKYRTYRNGFLSANGGYWARHPELIPDRAELPASFKVDSVGSAVTRCHQDGAGKPRLFSWKASNPLIVVYLADKQGPKQRYYAAAFTPGNHRKLTLWTAAPKPWGVWKTEMPYLNPFWSVDHVLNELPGSLRTVLQP